MWAILAMAAAWAEDATIQQVGWLAGCWRSESAVSEECWLAPRSGLMLGVHRDVRPGRAPFFEHLRIERFEGRLRYVASPKGMATTAFGLTEAVEGRVVFENPEHDFPRKLTYRLADRRTLEVVAEGIIGDKPRQETWILRKAKFPLQEP